MLGGGLPRDVLEGVPVVVLANLSQLARQAPAPDLVQALPLVQTTAVGAMALCGEHIAHVREDFNGKWVWKVRTELEQTQNVSEV